MLHRTIATLAGILRPELALSKSRVETLCMIVIGLVSFTRLNIEAYPDPVPPMYPRSGAVSYA